MLRSTATFGGCDGSILPHPNRVQPDGTFLATPARGTLTGNRGVLHGADGIVGAARWKHRAWVCCELSFRGRHRPIMPPGRWTALFFLDELVALAAGHRPCGQCRHADYRRFADAWNLATGHWPGAVAMDREMHAARAHPGARLLRHHVCDAGDLPDGTMVEIDRRAHLVLERHALPYGPDGYGAPRPMPDGDVTVLTNAATVRVLGAGYRPRLHRSARARANG